MAIGGESNDVAMDKWDHKVYTRPINVGYGGSTAPVRVRVRSGTSGPHIGWVAILACVCGRFWIANETAGGVATLLRMARCQLVPKFEGGWPDDRLRALVWTGHEAARERGEGKIDFVILFCYLVLK